MTDLKKDQSLSPQMTAIVTEASRFQGVVPMRAISEVLVTAAQSLLPQIKFVHPKMTLHRVGERELQQRWLGLSNQLLNELYDRFQIFANPSRGQMLRDKTESMLDDLVSRICSMEQMSPDLKAELHGLVITAYRRGCEVGEVLDNMPSEPSPSS